MRLIGLYGLEEVGASSGPTVDPDALARWRPVMAEVAEVAERSAPVGVSVERKPVAFTLHFRHAPAEEPWVRRFADEQHERIGLVIQPGRMAIELRPGIETDKGTVVAALAHGAVSYTHLNAEVVGVDRRALAPGGPGRADLGRGDGGHLG